MQDDAELYNKVNGIAKAAQVTSSQFGEVEKDILKAGAMMVVIRNVTMPPGARIVTTDHYPTLRMVENGQLILSSIPESSDAARAESSGGVRHDGMDAGERRKTNCSVKQPAISQFNSSSGLSRRRKGSNRKWESGRRRSATSKEHEANMEMPEFLSQAAK